MQLPIVPSSMGVQERQELPFTMNSFHLSFLVKGHFPDFIDSFVQENFSVASPQTSNLTWNNYETNILNIVLLEENSKTKIYPCGGTYIYIDVPSEEAFPPCLSHIQASLPKILSFIFALTI